jgi:hypothetical protein
VNKQYNSSSNMDAIVEVSLNHNQMDDDGDHPSRACGRDSPLVREFYQPRIRAPFVLV